MHRLVMDTFRTQTGNHFFANVFIQHAFRRLFSGKLERVAFKIEEHIVAFFGQRAVDEVHLRRADKSGHENVAGIVIKVLRRIDLLNKTVFHDHDTGGHRHSLDLVVRHINEGGLHSLMEFGQLGSHGRAQFRVQVGKRLVQKKHFRVADNGTTQRHTLFLTAGQSLRLTVQQVRDVQDPGSFLHTALNLFLGGLVQFQAESHVIKHRHVRIKRVVLEHHGDFPILRRHIVDQLVADKQLALGDLLQARDHTQGRGLTATGRADKNDKFLILDFQIEIRNRSDTTGIFFINVPKRKACHALSSLAGIKCPYLYLSIITNFTSFGKMSNFRNLKALFVQI